MNALRHWLCRSDLELAIELLIVVHIAALYSGERLLLLLCRVR